MGKTILQKELDLLDEVLRTDFEGLKIQSDKQDRRKVIKDEFLRLMVNFLAVVFIGGIPKRWNLFAYIRIGGKFIREVLLPWVDFVRGLEK